MFGHLMTVKHGDGREEHIAFADLEQLHTRLAQITKTQEHKSGHQLVVSIAALNVAPLILSGVFDNEVDRA